MFYGHLTNRLGIREMIRTHFIAHFPPLPVAIYRLVNVFQMGGFSTSGSTNEFLNPKRVRAPRCFHFLHREAEKAAMESGVAPKGSDSVAAHVVCCRVGSRTLAKTFFPLM